MRYPLWAGLILLAAVAGQAAEERAFFRTASGAWQPLACTTDAKTGVVRFTVDPARVRGNTTTVVLNVARGVRLDDDEPPRITGLKVDGRPYPVTKWPLDLDWLPRPPQNIRIGLCDAGNRLDWDSVRLSLDGNALDPRAFASYGIYSDRQPQHAAIDLGLGPLLDQPGQLSHTLALSVADRSPQRNRVALALSYSYLAEAALTESPTILTDSCHQGYEDLKVLTDGVVMTPGKTTYAVTWASAEAPGNHWVVFAWPEARELREVEVFWAAYSGTFWGSRRLLAQTWEQDRWVTRCTRDDLPAEPSTKLDLGGVKTTRLRLLQADGQGRPERPEIMWITEIKVQ